MTAFIDLSPGAEYNALARELVDDIRRNVEETPSKRRDFRLLRGSVAMIASDAGLAVTLRFDHGRLTVHDGIVGVPDVSVRGDIEALRLLRRTPLSRRLGVPFARPRDVEGRTALWSLTRSLAQGRLTIYGLWFHGPLVLRLVRVLSSSG